MCKLIGDPIRVHQNTDGKVYAFIWRKRYYRIQEILEQWYEPDEWWAGRAMRHFARINAASHDTGAGIYEIFKLGDEWFLDRVLD